MNIRRPPRTSTKKEKPIILQDINVLLDLDSIFAEDTGGNILQVIDPNSTPQNGFNAEKDDEAGQNSPLNPNSDEIIE